LAKDSNKEETKDLVNKEGSVVVDMVIRLEVYSVEANNKVEVNMEDNKVYLAETNSNKGETKVMEANREDNNKEVFLEVVKVINKVEINSNKEAFLEVEINKEVNMEVNKEDNNKEDNNKEDNNKEAFLEVKVETNNSNKFKNLDRTSSRDLCNSNNLDNKYNKDNLSNNNLNKEEVKVCLEEVKVINKVEINNNMEEEVLVNMEEETCLEIQTMEAEVNNHSKQEHLVTKVNKQKRTRLVCMDFNLNILTLYSQYTF